MLLLLFYASSSFGRRRRCPPPPPPPAAAAAAAGMSLVIHYVIRGNLIKLKIYSCKNWPQYGLICSFNVFHRTAAVVLRGRQESGPTGPSLPDNRRRRGYVSGYPLCFSKRGLVTVEVLDEVSMRNVRDLYFAINCGQYKKGTRVKSHLPHISRSSFITS